MPQPGEPRNLDHILKAIELGGLLTLEQRPVSLQSFVSDYFQRIGEDPPGGNRAERLRETFLKLAGYQVLEGQPGAGTSIDRDFREDCDWILPLVDLYLTVERADRRHPALMAALNAQGVALLGMVVTIGIALRSKEVLSFGYRGSRAEAPEERRVLPLSLVVRGDRLLLMAFDLDRMDLRQFLLLRMTPRIETSPSNDAERELLGQFRNRNPYSDSLGVFQGGEARDVLLRFELHMAADLEREFFHETQRIETLQDCIELRLRVNNAHEVFSLVSRFMNSCELVEPEDWREWYIGRLQRALQRHGAHGEISAEVHSTSAR